MMSNLFIGRDAFIDFTVSVTGLALIIPVLFWLFFCEREFATRNNNNRITTRILFWLILIPLVLLIAPGSSFVIQKLIGSQPLIDTMIAIPTAMVTVYAFIHMTNHLKIHGHKLIYAIICLVILIVISNSIFISYDHPLGIRLISNSMKIDPEVQEICKKIGSNYVLLPEEVYGQIGEYDSGVTAGSLCEVPHDRYYAINAAKAAKDAQSSLFIIRKSYDNNPSDIEYYYHYKKSSETKHYVIYQRSEE